MFLVVPKVGGNNLTISSLEDVDFIPVRPNVSSPVTSLQFIQNLKNFLSEKENKKELSEEERAVINRPLSEIYITGKEKVERFTATPSKLPATIIWYWGAFSQKYFSEVSALSHNCISSNTIKVFSLTIVTPAICDKIGIR